MRLLLLLTLLFWALINPQGVSLAQEPEQDPSSHSRTTNDYVVYSVNQALSLSDDPKLQSPKDYYINMGEEQGLKAGSILEVRRKIATYDLMTEQLYRDITVPIAKIKVIYVEPLAAIARLEKLSSSANHPVFSPRAVMVGDYVRQPN